MSKLSRKMLALLLILGLIFSVAACGKAEAPKPAQPAQPAPAPEPPKEIVYKVGTEPAFPPFEFEDPKTKEISGFDIDLVKAIAEAAGFKVTFKGMGFDGLIPALQSGTIDIIASGMTITEERAKAVDFTSPYVNSGLAIAVGKNNTTIKSEADLKGKKVAVQIGTTGAKYADELKKKGMIASIRTYNSTDIALAELGKGTVDAVINDLPVTSEYISKGTVEAKVIGELLSVEQYGFAVAKGKKEALDKMNAGLKKVIESGKYAELLKKYSLPASSQPK